MAAGLSNREIAERLFVSENTVKTHAARLFDKLSARRRTQAVQRAKEAGLIP
jgi:ATP/maltotriose-dependent transcriptional regulator MalT